MVWKKHLCLRSLLQWQIDQIEESIEKKQELINMLKKFQQAVTDDYDYLIALDDLPPGIIKNVTNDKDDQ